MKRLIVGMSGASGAIYGIRLLEVLGTVADVRTELVLSNAARQTIALETDWRVDDVKALADCVHPVNDIAASISSGSYPTFGMVVIPCSVRTLSAIANCHSDTLLTRAADVVLKEHRRLVLVLRESPLHLGHARNMVQAIEMGARLVPAMPGFYHRPRTVDDLVNQLVNRVIDQLDIELERDLFSRWQGARSARRGAAQSASGDDEREPGDSNGD
jgi:4-hydroxy-3-polyprenylbenzoate decarboxylase